MKTTKQTPIETALAPIAKMSAREGSDKIYAALKEVIATYSITDASALLPTFSVLQQNKVDIEALFLKAAKDTLPQERILQGLLFNASPEQKEQLKNAVDENGRTAFMLTINQGAFQFARENLVPKKLEERPEFFSKEDSQGNTVFHQLLANPTLNASQKKAGITELLEKTPNFFYRNTPNQAGKTPIETALQQEEGPAITEHLLYEISRQILRLKTSLDSAKDPKESRINKAGFATLGDAFADIVSQLKPNEVQQIFEKALHEGHTALAHDIQALTKGISVSDSHQAQLQTVPPEKSISRLMSPEGISTKDKLIRLIDLGNLKGVERLLLHGNSSHQEHDGSFIWDKKNRGCSDEKIVQALVRNTKLCTDLITKGLLDPKGLYTLPSRDSEDPLQHHHTTLLHLAAEAGNAELCGWLVKNTKASALAKDDHGQTPVHCAAKTGQYEVNQVFLSLKTPLFGKNPFKERDQEGKTPLHCLAETGTPSMYKALAEDFIACGARKNVRGGPDKQTPEEMLAVATKHHAERPVELPPSPVQSSPVPAFSLEKLAKTAVTSEPQKAQTTSHAERMQRRKGINEKDIKAAIAEIKTLSEQGINLKFSSPENNRLYQTSVSRTKTEEKQATTQWRDTIKPQHSPEKGGSRDSSFLPR